MASLSDVAILRLLNISVLQGTILIRRTLGISLLITIIIISVNITLALITNVPTHISKEDDAVFRSILKLEKPTKPLSFDEQIALISTLQKHVLDDVPVGKPIPEQHEREPADLYSHRSGLCYDRSRTYDKLFSWFGFESRHVYLLYPEHPVSRKPLYFWQALITNGTNSHAVTEVRTPKGWLVVDSNSPWISVTRDGTPIDADGILAHAQEFETIPGYFNRPYWAIRGLYSRRGQFYRPYIPYPELNWHDFWSWVLGFS